jgi:hypothetical protein
MCQPLFKNVESMRKALIICVCLQERNKQHIWGEGVCVKRASCVKIELRKFTVLLLLKLQPCRLLLLLLLLSVIRYTAASISIYL